MSALTQAQVDDVLARYEPDQLVKTLNRFARRPDTQRQRTLRSHKEEPIEDAREIALRDDLDEFLEMCSALEVLTIATGEVPELDSGLRAAIVQTLSDRAILQYYTTTYPSPLPVLLLDQLTNGDRGPASHAAVPGRGQQAIDPTPLLLAFFELDARPWRNRDLQFFFDLLDGFKFDGFGLNAFLSMLGREKVLSQVLSGRKKSSSYEVQSLNGFCQFAAMCHDLDQLCSRSAPLPLLSSAIWLNFSYWFCERGHYLRRVTREISSRLSRSAKAAPSFNDLDEYMTGFVRMVDKLTLPDKFAMPLVEAAAPLLNDWAAAHGLPVVAAATTRAQAHEAPSFSIFSKTSRARRTPQEESGSG